MSQRSIYYQGNLSSPTLLEESDDLFVMRVARGADHRRVLAGAPGMQPNLSGLALVAAFPGSDVYVYRVSPSAGTPRDEVKELVEAANSPDLLFIGSVFTYSNTGIYQLYTENIFLQFQPGVSQAEANRFLNGQQLLVKRPMHFGEQVYFLESASDQGKGRRIFEYCAELLHNPLIRYCHPELVTQLHVIDRNRISVHAPNPIRDNQWWLKRVGALDAWRITQGNGVTIAVIDDGLEMAHPAFAQKIVHGRDMMATSPVSPPHHQFNETHGTACASVACSRDEQAPGVAPQARLLPLRITGLGSVLQSEAIYWAVQHGADVISCSWGPPDGDISDTRDDDFVFPLPDHTRLAFQYAVTHGRRGKGTSIVFAAGNGKEPVDNDGYASAKEVIAVGAVNYKDQPTRYADFGSSIHCCFPSGDNVFDPVRQTVLEQTGIMVADRIGEMGYSPGNYYHLFTGTSASCPGVAGVIALMYAVNPALTADQVRAILKESCERIGNPAAYNPAGKHIHFGYGLLRADRAVQLSIPSSQQSSSIMNPNKSAISLHIGIDTVDPKYYQSWIPPLFGCVNDMRRMGELARRLGYETHFLPNEQASKQAIFDNMVSLGNQVEDGGILLISYSGHGVQLPDDHQTPHAHTDQEEDARDESWVTYDGFMLDDEVFNALANINRAIRVVLISDSCHSETMSRDIITGDTVIRNRGITPDVAVEILRRNNQTTRGLRTEAGPRKDTYRVFVQNLSASRGSETAKEINNAGVFTTSLLEEFARAEQEKNIDYDEFIRRIERNVNKNGRLQEPNRSVSHLKSEAFLRQFPFDTTKISISSNQMTSTIPTSGQSASAPPSAPVQPSKNRWKKLFFASNALLVSLQTKTKNAPQAMRAVQLDDQFIQTRSLSGAGAWDKAYAYFLQQREENLAYVEPDIVSNLYASDALEGEERSVVRERYLDTYPNPEAENSPNPFTWHLDSDHSQLRQASELVFPEVKMGAHIPPPYTTVKIAHIDTGYLPQHPANPAFLDTQHAKSFDWGNDLAVDNDAFLFPAEQQGHGNATMAILAGKWVNLDETDNRYQGFFGAIPYAQVLPIKISETVALLSGKNFAQAVDYAIEQGCDVITMSMAGLPSKVMAEAVNRAYEAGVVLVSAAGNSWSQGAANLLPKTTMYPARYDRVVAAVGAAFDKKPYLNRFHERAAGGRYMQTCYGPESVLPTSIAAYTPNVIWFSGDKKNGNGPFRYYVLTGGGTSSATPQVAAAAALYVQKYKQELSKYAGKDAWKKAEIVRQALFQSANAGTPYNYIYGRGLLQAFEMLKPEYAPQKLEKGLEMAKAAPERYRFLGGIFGMYRSRGFEIETPGAVKDNLENMLFMEIQQLLHVDPELFEFLDDLDFQREDVNLFDFPGLVEKLMQSPFASDFLKAQLAMPASEVSGTLRSNNGEFNNVLIKNEHGNISVRARGFTVSVSGVETQKEYYEASVVWTDSFTLELGTSRSIRAGADVELHIDLLTEMQNMQTALLIEEVYEEGSVYKWMSSELDAVEGKRTRGIGSGSTHAYTLVLGGIQPGERGIIQDAKKLVVKLVKWVKGEKLAKIALDKLIDHVGDRKYQVLVYDLLGMENNLKNGWTDIRFLDEKNVFQEIQQDKKPALLMLHGLFSSVERGFDDLLDHEDRRSELATQYCRYVIGLNMPTVVHDVVRNADELSKLLNGKLKQKQCTVLARSRGGLVGRYLFEKTWTPASSTAAQDAPFVLQKFIMFGTPNMGTPLADPKHIRSLLNTATNIARITLGTVAPVVPTVLAVIKAISMNVLELPGIIDQRPDSKLLAELNGNERADRSKYFVFAANHEPQRKIFKRLFDELIIDRAIFKGVANDTIVPVPSVLFRKDATSTSILGEHQCFVCSASDDIDHFGYLNNKKLAVVNQMRYLMGASSDKV